jgi:hypothetical protein
MRGLRARCRDFAVHHLDWKVIADHYRHILEQLSL